MLHPEIITYIDENICSLAKIDNFHICVTKIEEFMKSFPKRENVSRGGFRTITPRPQNTLYCSLVGLQGIVSSQRNCLITSHVFENIFGSAEESAMTWLCNGRTKANKKVKISWPIGIPHHCKDYSLDIACCWRINMAMLWPMCK